MEGNIGRRKSRYMEGNREGKEWHGYGREEGGEKGRYMEGKREGKGQVYGRE